MNNGSRFRLIAFSTLVIVALAGCSGAAADDSSPSGPSSPSSPKVASLTVTAPSSAIVVGSTTQLTATPKDASGAAVSGQAIAWSSANGAIASVSSSGLVTGVAPGGPVTITATAAGVTGSVPITVNPVPVASVTVTPGTPSVKAGSTLQLAATVKDASGSVLNGRTVTWSVSNTAIATVSSSGLLTGVAAGTVNVTATCEGVTSTVAVTVGQPSFNAALHLRRQITVTTGTAAIPAGYSVPMTFDHASLVASNTSTANGQDVRVAYWNGTAWVELDRVTDTGSSWNSPTTTIWFKTQVPMAANSSDNNYYLYYDGVVITPPPQNPSIVFLWADDFETANFNKWLPATGGLWQIDNTRSHHGTFAAMYPTEGGGSYSLIANPPLNMADVYVDAWWQINALSDKWNVSQDVRRDDGDNGTSSLLCKCIGSLGWNVATYINDHYADVNAPAGTIQANTWMRVGTGMAGTTFQVFLNGALINSATGLTGIISGNVGFTKNVTPLTASGVIWIDDVIVRRWAIPEPTTSVGSETVAP
jgi:Bacterial Ig-like domain (group 2)